MKIGILNGRAVVCAWCKIPLNRISEIRLKYARRVRISHGICKSCYLDQVKELRKRAA